jgi:hypothetical protein
VTSDSEASIQDNKRKRVEGGGVQKFKKGSEKVARRRKTKTPKIVLESEADASSEDEGVDEDEVEGAEESVGGDHEFLRRLFKKIHGTPEKKAWEHFRRFAGNRKGPKVEPKLEPVGIDPLIKVTLRTN